jgi:hypothetical protein
MKDFSTKWLLALALVALGIAIPAPKSMAGTAKGALDGPGIPKLQLPDGPGIPKLQLPDGPGIPKLTS